MSPPRRAACACAVMLATSFAAAETPPVMRGYAFDQPLVLADQILWGVFSASRLLARQCAGAAHYAAANAWVNWQERERDEVLAINSRLARYYFNSDAAPLDLLDQVLRLQTSLDLTTQQLQAACASLPQALAQPRYDLGRRRAAILEGVGRHDRDRR